MNEMQHYMYSEAERAESTARAQAGEAQAELRYEFAGDGSYNFLAYVTVWDRPGGTVLYGAEGWADTPARKAAVVSHVREWAQASNLRLS